MFFKLKIPMKVILSSGSLLLLAIGSILIFATNSAYTSDIQATQQTDESLPMPTIFYNHSTTTNQTFPEHKQQQVAGIGGNTDSRRRNGRLFSQSIYDRNLGASALETYAAAYAAANAPSSSSSSGLSSGSSPSSSSAAAAGGPVSQSLDASLNDPNAYASFGEQPSAPQPASPSTSAGSTLRQLPSSLADYATPPQTSYYASYMSPSSNAASYANGGAGANPYHHSHNNYQTQSYLYHAKPSSGNYANSGYLGGNSRQYSSAGSSYYDRAYLDAASAAPYWASSPTLSSGGGGLMSSASNALSHWTGGFGVSEIICAVVAITIGAVILGAPFFLIYLALMGNFSGSGTLSLTNPASGGAATGGGGGATVAPAGRRKRSAIFENHILNRTTPIPRIILNPMNKTNWEQTGNEFSTFADSVVSQLSPFVDMQQVSMTFKRLVNSIEKFSNLPKVTAPDFFAEAKEIFSSGKKYF